MTGPTFCTDCKRMRHLGCRKCLDRARSQVMERLGLVFVLAFLALAFAPGAHAEDSRRQLVLHFYASANAAGLPERSLGIQLEDVYPDYASCVAAGERRLRQYVPGMLPDGAMLLEYFGCERVRA